MSNRSRILEALRESGGHVSGHELAERLEVSRTAVWKHVEALKEQGYVIDSVHGRGYRLVEAADVLSAEEVNRHLSTQWLGRELLCLDATASTNSDASRLGREATAAGAVVTAEEQTRGRGRLGRSWESARGVNLYMSVLLRPEISPAEAPRLSLVAGVAVAAALENLGLNPRIKWPNDVLIGGRKVCGVLTEMEGEADRVAFVVVGIGVNLNSDRSHFPPELHDKATSVAMQTGTRVDRALFTADLLQELEKRYEMFAAGAFGSVIDEWNARAALAGRELTISGAGAETCGICVGIDADGALLLESPTGEVQRVLAGDVTVVGGYE